MQCREGNPKPLPPKVERARLLMEAANNYMLNGNSHKQTVDLLYAVHDVPVGSCYYYIQQAIALFGNLKEANKEGLKQIAIERMHRLAALAEKANDLFTAKECLKEINKLQGLYNEEKALDASLVVLPTIMISSDPSILKEPETVDIPHHEE